jgi:uncharacterized membrane protein YciS (DUF1049 family)
MISYFVNYAIGAHVPTGYNVWRIPFGLQLVPAGIMVIGLFFVKVRLHSISLWRTVRRAPRELMQWNH